MKVKNYLKTHKYVVFSLFYIGLYFLAFFLLEKMIVTDYYVCYLFLDDYIPFCEWFMIPYVLWYGYLFLPGFYFLIKDKDEFLRFFFMVPFGMSMCLIICLLFPNGQNLRPEYFANENILTRLVANLYAADTNTNVLPSMHVFGSLGVHAAICRSKLKLAKPWIKWVSFVLCVSICLSTVFIKQHSVLDGFAAILLFIPFYVLIYKKDFVMRLYKKLEKKEYKKSDTSQIS